VHSPKEKIQISFPICSFDTFVHVPIVLAVNVVVDLRDLVFCFWSRTILSLFSALDNREERTGCTNLRVRKGLENTITLSSAFLHALSHRSDTHMPVYKIGRERRQCLVSDCGMGSMGR